MTGLPTWIGATLQGKLENVSRADLRRRAQAFSDAYRTGGNSEIVRSELDALAYAVARMPATYAAVHATLAHTVELIPHLQPISILDAGAGPGTASWAGIDIWPSVQRATLIDSNPRLLDLARTFYGANRRTALATDVVLGDLSRALRSMSNADVVIASYALAETTPAALRDTLNALWSHADRLLVIVEPGTVNGFQRVLKCRDVLIETGATIIAPCSHEGRCPLARSARWCHFAARLPRSRDHMITKSARVPFEDEKFCYLVAGKGFPDIPKERRILATPEVSKAGITLTLCAPDQPEERRIERRDKEAYKAAKRLGWGDLADV